MYKPSIRPERYPDDPEGDLLSDASEGLAMKSHWISDLNRNGSALGTVSKYFPEHTNIWGRVLQGEEVNGNLSLPEKHNLKDLAKRRKQADKRRFRKGKTRFSFIDLIAGIGGFRMALESVGGECVFSSEIDSLARETYAYNFGEYPFGDITKFTSFYRRGNREGADPGDPKDARSAMIPKNPGILCGGFPCQSFSVIGRRQGFDDKGRGDMFKQLCKLLGNVRPRAFILENVSALVSHDGGRSLQRIRSSVKRMNYSFDCFRFHATDFGLPQNRKRVVLVGVDLEEMDRPEFDFQDMMFRYRRSSEYRKYSSKKIWNILGVSKKVYFRDKWKTYSGRMRTNPGIGYALRCGGALSPIEGKHNWDGYSLNGKIHRITPRQCADLMGFPPAFKFPPDNIMSYTRKKIQAGNSVPYPVIRTVAKELINKSDILG